MSIRYALPLVFVLLVGCTDRAAEPESAPLFNGVDLTGWIDVYDSPGTWTVSDSMIVCTGEPYGMLHTIRMYENFVVELEWRHMKEGGNAGLFVHADALPAVGKPFARTIEAQILDGNQGDVFAMNGALFIPNQEDPTRAMRSLPTAERVNPAGEWNHYRFESNDGTLTLAINGEVVNGGTGAVPRKGYIALESEGSEVHFRNIRIVELPSTEPEPAEVAIANPGFGSLYNGIDLEGWTVDGAEGWTPNGWRLGASGDSVSTLWRDLEAETFELMVDWRVTGDSTGSVVGGIALGPDGQRIIGFGSDAGGSGTLTAPAVDLAPQQRADRPVGQWNRMLVSVREGSVSVLLNEIAVVTEASLGGGAVRPGLVQLGAGPFEVANVFFRELP